MLKLVLLQILAFSLSAPASWAKEYCMPAAELRSRVVYCDQNFDYYEAAKACKDKYLKHVNAERERIKSRIATLAALSTESAQDGKLEHSSRIFSSTIAELDSLIHYGQEVHTEIEDYVYELVLPAFNEAEAQANLEDPRVKAEFMSRECYGDPHTQMELMQKEIRPIVADLEKTLAEAQALKNLTGKKKSNLDSLINTPDINTNAPKANSGKDASTNDAVNRAKKYRESDISGTEEKKPGSH